ncbi:hypothetical protein [Aeromonas hydrophila]|uniref:hypothetical protein n=1 Tax=Aeromonas hydrophila TaxID=644 RepID=UPI002B49E442|nr:hypothetical protein [Aeromonas hydrophila]
MSNAQQVALLECDRVFNEIHFQVLRASTPKASLEELLTIGDGHLIRDNERAIARVHQYAVLSEAINKTTSHKLKQTLYEASLVQSDAPLDVLYSVFTSDNKTNEAESLKRTVLRNPSIPVSVMVDAFRGADIKSMFAVIQNPALPVDFLHEAVNHHYDFIVEGAIKNPSINAESLEWVLRQRSEKFIPAVLRSQAVPHSYLERFSSSANVEILKAIVSNKSTPESVLRALLDSCNLKKEKNVFSMSDRKELSYITYKAYSHNNWALTLEDVRTLIYSSHDLRAASLNPGVNQEFISAVKSLKRDAFEHFAIQSQDAKFLINEANAKKIDSKTCLTGLMNSLNIASLGEDEVNWLYKKRPSPERAFIMLNVSRRLDLPYELRVKAMVKAIYDLSYSEANAIGVAVFHRYLKLGLDALSDLRECKREITDELDKTGISLHESYRECILSELLNSSARALNTHIVESKSTSRRML